ncbi:50S ribosomal protein L11 methyltransferase [Thermodesulfobacteriota bacterium]
MKWTEAKVIFESADKEFAVDLISNLLYDCGLKGVVVEDPEEDLVDGWSDGSHEKPPCHAVIGYFPQSDALERQLDALESGLDRLNKENHILSSIVYRQVDEEAWAESWKAHFQPEKITERIVVKPTWRDYAANSQDIVLEIDPGMAFGTGTHPTTALCIRMIEKYLEPGRFLLDIGTGSGILMIAAAKLGAGTLWGIDNDPVAVEIAVKNLAQNKIEPERFSVLRGNLADNIEQKFDMVVANILSQVIIELLDNITNVLKQDGIFICSGIFQDNKDPVLQKMEQQGFVILEVQTKEDWVAVAGKF